MAKYLTEFNTYADYSGATLSLPNVSLIKNTGEVYYNPMFRGATVGDVLMYDVANQKLVATLNAQWDATTYPIASYEPIAICVIPSTNSGDGKGRWVSTLIADSNGSGTTSTNYKMRWSTESVLVGTSTNENNYVGRSNTNAILATPNFSQSTYPAAYAVNAFSTSGTVSGDWYLPSLGELKAAESVRTLIDAQLTLIKNANNSKAVKFYGTWTSTEYNQSNVWFGGGGTNPYKTGKQQDNLIRPMLSI